MNGQSTSICFIVMLFLSQKCDDYLILLPNYCLKNKKRPYKNSLLPGKSGAPSRIRTYDLWIRSPLLYPAELWAQNVIIIA